MRKGLIDITVDLRSLINNRIYKVLEKTCVKLIDDALSNREYDSFTGNTITSYACGIYFDGGLIGTVFSADGMRKPIAKKIKKGKKLYLKNPYEGKSRTVLGKVDVSDGYGYDFSESFLLSYKPYIKKGYTIVMTTGTEYSEYLENVRELNVLTETKDESSDIMLQEVKSIINEKE